MLERPSFLRCAVENKILKTYNLIVPDLDYMRRKVSGGFSEIIAALLWQIGVIKVGLGDLKPCFKVNDRKNRSPIYIDLKGRPDYPSIFDFFISASAFLLALLDF